MCGMPESWSSRTLTYSPRPPSQQARAGCALLNNLITTKARPHKPQRAPALDTRHNRRWAWPCHVFGWQLPYSQRVQFPMQPLIGHPLYATALGAGVLAEGAWALGVLVQTKEKWHGTLKPAVRAQAQDREQSQTALVNFSLHSECHASPES